MRIAREEISVQNGGGMLTSSIRRARCAPLSYTIYLEIGLSTSKCPQKHGGFDVTGVQLGYAVNAVYH